MGLIRGLEGVAGKPFFTALPCIVHVAIASQKFIVATSAETA